MEKTALRPEEWDFRKIREDELHAAIQYEYARSCDWVRGIFNRWHRASVPQKYRWAGTTVHELLLRSRDEPLPDSICEWFSERMPDEFGTRNLLQIWRVNPLFPEPFLKASIRETAHIKRSDYGKCPAFWEVTVPGSLPPIAWLSNAPAASEERETNTLRTFTICMDFRFSKTRIKKEMWQWLNGLDDSMVEKIRMPKAKAATLPWFQLKELAAYRLAKVAGMNFKNAQSFVADYKRKFPSKSPTDVLPSYKASGFCEAVKSAEDYIRKLFPKP